MNTTITTRIDALRELLRHERLAAFIFPSTDPHQSEYVPDRWKGREWISGFTGSAGTVVVTLQHAALWTDSRYFLAAEAELRGTGISLMKLKVEGTPSIAEWLGRIVYDESKELTEVGVDGQVCSINTVEQLRQELMAFGLTLRTNFDPLQQIWAGRPAVPDHKVRVHPLQYAGESADSKLGRIRRELRRQHADGMLVSALDDVAWTLNLRGTDVSCNPVFVAYLVIEPDNATLFIDEAKLTAEVKDYLRSLDVAILPYTSVGEYLHKDYFNYNILLDPDETNYRVLQQMEGARTKVVRGRSPIPAMKAVKNEVEIEGFHNAMLRDGVAMVKFLRWLGPAVEAGGQTEISVSDKLLSLRREQPLFQDISFETIAGFAAHGAIVHYEATPSTDMPLEPRGLLLLDSGAQYLDGTTDITRTIPLGPLTDEERRVYTLVLKAHIQLELAKFPDGACGTQIDALAREPLWRNGLNFLHGTGHGVGSYLCVHEGPHQIRMEHMAAPLHAGMTVTDEPGVYVDGKFGVRIENTLLITDYLQTQFGRFLQMEPLTLCPISLAPVIDDMLTDEERNWLHQYHSLVCNKLRPHLTPDENRWLIDYCRLRLE